MATLSANHDGNYKVNGYDTVTVNVQPSSSISFSNLSGSVDNVSLSSGATSVQYIDIPVPSGSSRAAMSLRGWFIENASSAGSNQSNCSVDEVYFSANQSKYALRLRNNGSSAAKIKVTLYISAAITA